MFKEQILMNTVLSHANHSKCISMKVGCFFYDTRGRVVASGVNGAIRGAPNCCDVHKTRGPEHSQWSLENEIHAEMNAIIELARSGVKAGTIDIYVTHSPCDNCLKHLLGLQSDELQIRNIVFNELYYQTTREQFDGQMSKAISTGVKYFGTLGNLINNPYPKSETK